MWFSLTVVFSGFAILYQVIQSIPGFLPGGPILSVGLKACIGTIQGTVAKFVVPFLASKVTREKHVFATVSTFIMNCLIPAAVIVYLDTGCLGRWVALWKPCRSNRQLFQLHWSCNALHGECRLGSIQDEGWEIDIIVVSASEICDPHFPWTATSMSSCIHISLLRLQEIWLEKFVITGYRPGSYAELALRPPQTFGKIHR